MLNGIGQRRTSGMLSSCTLGWEPRGQWRRQGEPVQEDKAGVNGRMLGVGERGVSWCSGAFSTQESQALNF